MFKIRMMVHAQSRNGEGFNLELYPHNEPQEAGFFLQSVATGGLTALVSKEAADKFPVGSFWDVNLTSAEKKNEPIASNSSSGDVADTGTGVSDVAADRPGHRRTR